MQHEFPGYRITEQLYLSARSSVERVVRSDDGAAVVLKQPCGAVITAEALRRVQHEYALLISLSGPGVVRAHAVVRDAGCAGIVLEDAGSSLAAWLAHHRFSLAEVVDIGLDLARTLARVHEAGVVHKDINPNNVMYDPARRAVTIIDFDLASRAQVTATDGVEGTLPYIAPEQTGRLRRVIDGRSDLYSLGATLYELLTGQPPFEGADELALVHAHLATQPARVDELEPAIPAVIADVVARLLDKNPEQRYQTGHGLAADLAECRRQLAETGRIDEFPIAQRDASPRFGFSDRLYGRDAELRALVDAFTRTASGGVEIAVVTGPAGVGKSALVRELYAPVMARRGYLVAGKFEQLQRDVPYSAVARSLGELVARILADPALERWQVAIAAALGDDAALVTAVVPLLHRIIASSPAAELEPDVAQRRLAGALTRLVQVFATRPHPLVMFFDDMQWADAASINLLVQLATSAQTESLLLLAACRELGVDPIDPFAGALRNLERRAVTISRLPLAPLSAIETADLVGDALHRAPDEVSRIADKIWRKTHGNPFFIRQFLQTMHDEGVITFDPGSNQFTLDAEALDRARITDNVADLLARSLAKLPETTRDVLVVAAAIGNRFDVTAPAIAAGRSELAVHGALELAVAAGLIVPAGPIVCVGDAMVGCSHYAFQHDRVQQAAYEASSQHVRESLHLSIGRHLLASCSPGDVADRLFDIVHHLNEGRALIQDETELARFVELAQLAAQQARRAGAFDVAATMLRSACASRTWRDHYATMLRCHTELVSVLTLAGLPREASAEVRAAKDHVTPRDRATFEALDATICSNLGEFVEAVACTRRAAALLDVDLPRDPAALQAAIAAEIGAIMGALPAGGVEAWADLPAMHDVDRREAMRLLTGCLPAAYQVEPPLLVLICAKLVTLSLRHGNCEESARGYAAFAIVLWGMGQLDLAFRFGKLGMDLTRRAPDHPIAPSVIFTFAVFVSPWRQPLEVTLELLRAMTSRAIDAGDLMHGGYGALILSSYGLLQGLPLRELLDETRRHRLLCIRLGLDLTPEWIAYNVWYIRMFMGVPPDPGEQDFDYDVVEATAFGQRRAQSFLSTLRLMELEHRFWRGDIAGAMAVTRLLAPMIPGLPGSPHNAEFRFYACLVHLAAGGAAEEIEPWRADLARYAECCPHNFGHMSALVEAELARVRGDATAAIAHYEAAIDGAAQAGFLKVEILGHQLAAQWQLARNKPAFAALHLAEARDRCELWGAQPHARALELRLRELGGTTRTVRSTLSRSTVATTLDFATVVKASHAIANDLVLDSLLAKLMAILVENTGAQLGAIVLSSADDLRLHVSWQAGRAVAATGGIALAAAHDVSEGIVRYVTRTRELVVLDDASRHATFRTDPYVREHRPRSVLCAPIVHNDRVLGAVYLENNLVAAAFTLDRLEALGIIVSQLAISIENAMMFAGLAAYRDHLEELVAERTQALTQANALLREQAMVRERMESELRLAQRLQSVGQLAAGVAHEINTPIQYIGDSVGFLAESFGALGRLFDAYRAAIDVELGRVDVAAIQRADEDADIDYLRHNVPHACELVRDGLTRVARIVRAMRSFSHPDQRNQVPTSLNAALETTLAVAHCEYSAVADVQTEFGDIPDVVCYIGEINQVFLNLIVNAAHAIADVVQGSGQRGTISITTRCEDRDFVVVTISDTGTGIPETIRDRVFDPFFTTKPVGKGTGQGLSLARTAIVDRHGGRIDFETRQNKGTTFFVRLPVHGRSAAASDDGAA